MRVAAVVAVAVLLAGVCMADDAGVLVVRGNGAEGRPRYDGGGKVRFTKAWVPSQVFHYAGGEEFPLQIGLQYDVLERAPIMLTTDMGTEYWRMFNYQTEQMTAIYTPEQVSLDILGDEQVASGSRARVVPRYGSPPAKGLCAITGRSYFLIRQPDGPWLDVVNPPAFFDLPATIREMVFTLANLDRYELKVSQVQSTWQPGGPLRVQVTITDADGETFPVVNCELRAIDPAAGWEAELATEWGPMNIPTGWMRVNLPEGGVPESVMLVGSVALAREYVWAGISQPIEHGIRRGDGQVTPEQMQATVTGWEPPRNADGLIRETRALWVALSDITTSEGADQVVARAAQARLNMLVPDIFVRNSFAATSDLMPMTADHAEGLDPLGYLIEKAHAAGLEVHPWFCVCLRDPKFRQWFEQTYGVNVDIIGEDGKPSGEGVDLHRPEYRDFIVKLMVGVARDYEVDGIHHDYIRTMRQCYCDKCRAEFQAQQGKPLTEATPEDWVAWQREAVGEIVRRVAEGVRVARPEAKLSAAVFSSLPSGASQGQDAAGWARQGWVDLVIPMDYSPQSLAVRANEKAFLEALGDERGADQRDKLVTGLSLYQRSGQTTEARPPDLPREQIEMVRAMGIHGYCLFVYGYLSDEIIRMLRDETNAEDAVPYFR